MISSHAHLPGVRLGLLGSFGNIHYASDEAAELAAIAHAGGRPMTVDRKTYPALPPYRGSRHD